MQITIQSEDDLSAFCQKVSRIIAPPMIIGLNGPMGSGKTTFVRHLGNALQSPDWINSPTYALMQSYSTPHPYKLLHIDLYRTNSETEIDLLDIPHHITPSTIVLIEWLNKTSQFEADLTLTFRIQETHRTIDLNAKKTAVLSHLIP